MRTDMYTPTNAHACMHANAHVPVSNEEIPHIDQWWGRAHTWAHVHARKHFYTHACIHIHAQMHDQTNKYTWSLMKVYSSVTNGLREHACSHTYAHTHTYLHTHTHIHTRARTHASRYTHACTHARTHAHAHTHTHTNITWSLRKSDPSLTVLSCWVALMSCSVSSWTATSTGPLV